MDTKITEACERSERLLPFAVVLLADDAIPTSASKM